MKCDASVAAGFTAAAAAAEDNKLVVSVATTAHTIVTHFIKSVITVPFDHDTTRVSPAPFARKTRN